MPFAIQKFLCTLILLPISLSCWWIFRSFLVTFFLLFGYRNSLIFFSSNCILLSFSLFLSLLSIHFLSFWNLSWCRVWGVVPSFFSIWVSSYSSHTNIKLCLFSLIWHDLFVLLLNTFAHVTGCISGFSLLLLWSVFISPYKHCFNYIGLMSSKASFPLYFLFFFLAVFSYVFLPDTLYNQFVKLWWEKSLMVFLFGLH